MYLYASGRLSVYMKGPVSRKIEYISMEIHSKLEMMTNRTFVVSGMHQWSELS
jgi:hypothetical protein